MDAGRGNRGTRRMTPRVAIVGAGFGGIATAIELRRAGIESFTLYERAPELGGVWWHNDYPGSACDIPSALYSYTYAQRKDWSKPCPSRDEVLGYLQGVAAEHGITERVRTGCEITEAHFDPARCGWTLRTAGGETIEADVLVLGTGQLSRPVIPPIDGRADFTGAQFHTAEWDHTVPLDGRRVTVIGTGATAVQVVPQLAGRVAHLDVVQRSAAWILPRQNEEYSRFVRAAIARVPGLQSLRRQFLRAFGVAVTAGLTVSPRFNLPWQLWSSAYLRSQVPDPELRTQLTPSDAFGCKRVLFSSSYLGAVQAPNVDLVTERVAEVTPHGVRFADGSERDTDVIVWATGFADALVTPLDVVGREGRHLADVWRDGERAHHGITVHGFPNAFVLYGPNTNLGSGSIIEMLEAQSSYIVQAIGDLLPEPGAALEVRAEAQAASNAALEDRMGRTVWMSCDSWYRHGHTGRVTRNWPGFVHEYTRAVAAPDPADFRVLRPLPAGVPARTEPQRLSKPGV